MSGETTPQAESSSPQTTAEAPRAEKKPRSSVERAIVWGGIVVLLLLVGVQAHARKGYEWTLNNLQPLIDDDREGGTPLALGDVDNYVVGFPSQSETSIDGNTGQRVYRWYGLGRSYGITISYNPGVEPVVVTGLETDNPPPPPAPPEVEESAEAPPDESMAGGGGGGIPMHDADGSGGGGGPGAGGPGGGGRRFNPMDNDADGDGKLSREEAPERMRDNFDEIDLDSSGFIDESEIEAMRERFRSRREQGAGDGGEGRPPRPAREGADESPAPDTTPGRDTDAEGGDTDAEAASDESPAGASEESETETP